MRDMRSRPRVRSGKRTLLATVAACAMLGVLMIPSRAEQTRTTTRPAQPATQQPAGRQQTEARPRRTDSNTSTQTTGRPSPTPTPAAPGTGPVIRMEAPPEMPNPAGQELGENETVYVDTDLVNLNVRFVDRQNRPLRDIRQEEIRVFEDGVPQTITFFSREEVPISYGLVIDNSGSMRSQINKVIEAGKIIVNSNRPGDETFLVRFVSSDRIETVQDFTTDRNAVIDSLEHDMYIEGGQTAVIDAVYLSAERMGQYRSGNDLRDRRRRALILVTDGEDRVSFYQQEQLFAALREIDVQIFVIGFTGELDRQGGFIRRSPRERAMNLMNSLAEQTGGRAFYPSSIAELPAIAEEITRDMRTQYVISYAPTNRAWDGTYRRVRVQVADVPGRERRVAVTRPGYTRTREGATGQPAAPRTGNAAPATPANTRPRRSP